MNLIEHINQIKNHPKVTSITEIKNTGNYRIIGTDFEKHIKSDALNTVISQLDIEPHIP